LLAWGERHPYQAFSRLHQQNARTMQAMTT